MRRLAAWWVRVKARWWRWKLDRRVARLPPLDAFKPEFARVVADDAALGALVAALQATGAAAQGAAIGVTLDDQSLWIWATDPDAYAALSNKVFLGGRPSALLAAWSDEDDALVRLYCVLHPRAFRDMTVALGAAHS
jgi:hypothetical protein